MLFAKVVAHTLLFGTLVLPGDAPDSPQLRQRAEEVVSVFRAGQLEQLMSLWSPDAPSKAADRGRLAILIDEGSAVDLSITDVAEEGARGLVHVELRRSRTPSLVLGRYTLELRLAEGSWRVWTLKSDEAERARQLLEATADERDRLMKTSPPTVALARELVHRGSEHLDRGEIERSVPVLALAAEIAERTGDGPTRAVAMRAQGRLAMVHGDLVAAARHYESSLTLSESSGDYRGAVKALHNLGNIARVSGDYARAEERWSTALALSIQNRDKVGQVRLLNTLGILRTTTGDYAGAITKYQESLTLSEQLNDTAGRTNALSNLGLAFRMQGAYRDAIDHFQKALQLSRGANNLEGMAVALANLGPVYTAQGDYVKALEVFQECLAIGQKIGNVDAQGGALSGIARIYSTLGNYPQALAHLEKSYALAERAGFKQLMAFLLHEIGDVLVRQGDVHRALEYYGKSQTAQMEMGNRPDVALNLNDIGKAHALLGNKIEARRSFEKSLEIAEQINDRETMLMVLGNLAESAKEPDEYERGLEFARRAITIATERGLPEKTWQTHLVLGRLYHRMNRLGEARAEIDRAIAIVEEIRREIPGEEMAEGAFESMVRPYQEMVSILVTLGDTASAFEYAERAKGRVLLDVLRQGRSDVSRAMTDAERDREKQLITQLVQLNRDVHGELTKGESNADHVADLRTKLGSARLEYEAFITGLYVAHPQLRIERGEVSPIRSTELGSLFASGETDAFVEFVVTDEVTYLFVVAPNRTTGEIELRVHSIEVTRKQLEDEVSRFRDSLAERELTYAQAARALFDKLLRPVEGRLRHAKQIGIVPDGPLWELPFQALQPVAGQFLLDRHAIFYASSITVLRETLEKKKGRAHPARSAELLAFGNPVVPGDVASRVRSVYRDASLGPLPQTETEVRQIASLYGQRESRVYLRKDAREEVVKREAATFRVLHFATHGILDDQSPLYSRLLFSRPNTANEDGVLEAREIMRLDLHADLAVLSACETGRGRVGAGEGLIGISWAFFVAGCPTTVVSQWKVSSAGTTDLMIEFHRRLRAARQENRTTAQALRRAALTLRANPAYRHPFYWAAFVLVGDGQ